MNSKRTRKGVIFLKNEIKKIRIEQKELKLKGSLYHITQVKFAYNSNHMEGSRLSEE